MDHRGDVSAFRENWRNRSESLNNYWCREEPINQVQLAFRCHWEVFTQILGGSHPFGQGRCLEVGCGRGSMSAYFADAGYDCTLCDLSPEVIDVAKKIFAKNQLNGQFMVGDVMSLDLPDNAFDVVVSIGLLEHFEDIRTPISEQIRVLDHGGIFLGYVVPHYDQNVQSEYHWINDILKGYESAKQTAAKVPLYRSDAPSAPYVAALQELGIRDIQTSGIYSLPMVSHSPEFPFSLMPPESELALVSHFRTVLAKRTRERNGHPWLCEEGYGQAFLVWGRKV